jgi:hypothetical protein
MEHYNFTAFNTRMLKLDSDTKERHRLRICKKKAPRRMRQLSKNELRYLYSAKCYYGYGIREGGMGETPSTHAGDEKSITILVE